MSDRDVMEFDVVIVGGGPAGLAAAIHLKQLAPQFSLAIIEKGKEIGAHILSGALVDPVGLDALLPDWRASDHPLRTPVTEDRFYWLSAGGAARIPSFVMPPLMSNHESIVASLGDVCRWLARHAENLGVEIFPGFAAVETVHAEDGAVVGIATGDMGVARDGSLKSNFQRGVELRARYTLLAEGARGSLTKKVIRKFGLDAGRQPQKYGIGLKELWRVEPQRHSPGFVQHTLGWPLPNHTGGGSFLYHLDKDLVSVGFVVHLNYDNPHLSPFEEFQRFKEHPLIAGVFEGGQRIGYGARAISEGGYQSVPKLTFPGGALVGCAAGFVNVPRIKGSHNAILSGMLAAKHLAAALLAGRSHDEIAGYEEGWRASAFGRELRQVRNVKPLLSRFGSLGGMALGGLDMWTNYFGFSFFGTLGHGGADYAALRPGAKAEAFVYARPDGVRTFDRLSSVFLANTTHNEDQPIHLHVLDPALQRSSEHDVYGGPSALYCPAAVYEWINQGDGPSLTINAANCVHCKACDIKDPNQNIEWTTPEGGSGPNYQSM